MHNHDQEIIMALAEGSLTPIAAAAAEAEISACAECSRDLELQRVAIDTLAAAPRAYLTAAESAQLHGRLHTELAVSTPEPVRVRSRLAWGRWVGAAAGAAAVFLAVFLVLPAMFGGGDDDASDMALNEIAAELDDAGGAETSAAATELAPPTREEMVGADDMAMLSGDGAVDAPTPEATTTAAAETTAAPATEDASQDLADYLAYFVEGDLTVALRDDVIGRLQADTGAFRGSDAAATRIEPDWAACLETDEILEALPDGADPQIVGIIADSSGADAGMERLLVALVTLDPDNTILVSITLPQCEVFETLP